MAITTIAQTKLTKPYEATITLYWNSMLSQYTVQVWVTGRVKNRPYKGYANAIKAYRREGGI